MNGDISVWHIRYGMKNGMPVSLKADGHPVISRRVLVLGSGPSVWIQPLGNDGIFVVFFFLYAVSHSQVGNGGSNEDGRESTIYHTQYHGKGETPDAFTSQEEDADKHD